MLESWLTHYLNSNGSRAEFSPEEAQLTSLVDRPSAYDPAAIGEFRYVFSL